MGHEDVVIAREDLSELVQEAIVRSFERLGISSQTPFEMQQDFAFLRNLRTEARMIRRRSLLTLVGVFTSGAALALWAGVKLKLGLGAK